MSTKATTGRIALSTKSDTSNTAPMAGEIVLDLTGQLQVTNTTLSTKPAVDRQPENISILDYEAVLDTDGISISTDLKTFGGESNSDEYHVEIATNDITVINQQITGESALAYEFKYLFPIPYTVEYSILKNGNVLESQEVKPVATSTFSYNPNLKFSNISGSESGNCYALSDSTAVSIKVAEDGKIELRSTYNSTQKSYVNFYIGSSTSGRLLYAVPLRGLQNRTSNGQPLNGILMIGKRHSRFALYVAYVNSGGLIDKEIHTLFDTPDNISNFVIPRFSDSYNFSIEWLTPNGYSERTYAIGWLGNLSYLNSIDHSVAISNRNYIISTLTNLLYEETTLESASRDYFKITRSSSMISIVGDLEKGVRFAPGYEGPIRINNETVMITANGQILPILNPDNLYLENPTNVIKCFVNSEINTLFIADDPLKQEKHLAYTYYDVNLDSVVVKRLEVLASSNYYYNRIWDVHYTPRFYNSKIIEGYLTINPKGITTFCTLYISNPK